VVRLIVAAGAAGLGLLWGWWLGLAGRQPTHAVRLALAAGTATALVALEVTALGGGLAAAVFAGAVITASLAHFVWLHEIRTRSKAAGPLGRML
jgi:hypothetical protein